MSKKIKNCITHHHACDCREELFEQTKKLIRLLDKNLIIEEGIDLDYLLKYSDADKHERSLLDKILKENEKEGI